MGFRDKLLGTKKKSKAMVKAVQEIEAHLKSKGTNLPELPNIPAPSDLNDSKAGGGGDDPDEADAEFDALLSGKTPSTAKKAKKRTSSTDSESSASATKKP